MVEVLVMGIADDIINKSQSNETMAAKPSHYHQGKFAAHEVEEQVFLNIARTGNLLAAKWASMGLKHLLRAGLKDDLMCELKKAENYLHRARTGEWLDD
jgi:hypothetical protein